MQSAEPPELVLLDVGGVLVLPDGEVVADAVRAAGVEPRSVADPLVAHYRAMAALDARDDAPEAADLPFEPLTNAWLAAMGIPLDDVAAARAVHARFRQSAFDLWRVVTPWARSGLSALAATGVTLGVVSNADGSVAAQLRAHRLAQVGPGEGVELAVLVDSDVVGVAKPDPAIFGHALAATGVSAARSWYVGDTVTFDATAATAAGIHMVHLDPHGWCPRPDGHDHVATLDDVARQVH